MTKTVVPARQVCGPADARVRLRSPSVAVAIAWQSAALIGQHWDTNTGFWGRLSVSIIWSHIKDSVSVSFPGVPHLLGACVLLT